MIDTGGDNAAFFDEFGVVASYTPPGGVPGGVTVVIDMEKMDEYGGLYELYSDFPPEYAAKLEHNGRTYMVQNDTKDEEGMFRTTMTAEVKARV